MILLNPGPVNLSERVRAALLRPDICHREPEFFTLQNEIRRGLLQVYDLDGDAWASVLLTGSGTAAVEAMIATLAPSDSTLMVIENGVYGERLTAIARAYGLAPLAVTHEWSRPIDLAAVESKIASNDGLSHIAVVHHETTTGRLNQLDRLAGLCKAHGLELLIDAVSSFGAEAIDFEAWPVAACAATANKCLHSIPGTAFVIVRRQALRDTKASRRSVYLDLRAYCEAQDEDGTPFTQSIQSYYALGEALDEFFEQGGWRQRHAHYHALAEQVREGLFEFGVAPLLPAEASSVVLRAYHLPAEMDYAGLHDQLKARGFVIYAGQGALSRRIFRISTMGDIGAADMHRFLAAMGQIL